MVSDVRRKGKNQPPAGSSSVVSTIGYNTALRRVEVGGCDARRFGFTMAEHV
jgi:hypothetical protein